MSGSELITWLSETLDFTRTLGSDLPGWLLAQLLETGQHLQPRHAGGLVFSLTALSVWGAFRLQKRLNDAIRTQVTAKVELHRLQWQASIWRLALIVVFFPIYLLWQAGRGGLWCVQALRRSRAKSKEGPSETKEPQVDSSVTTDQSSSPHLTASLGPTYLLAALGTVAIYLLGRLTDPLLAAYFNLSPGSSGWQFLLLGKHPSIHTYLPLEQQPWLAAVLTFLLWSGLWSLLGFLLRCFLGSELGRNLLTDREREDCLPWWRQGFGCEYLHRPAPAYLSWASWPLGLAVPLLCWAWLWIGSDPYRLESSQFALGLLIWLSWVLTLLLRGSYQPGIEARTSGTPGLEHAGPNWFNVLADLRQRHQVGEPETFAHPRPVRAPAHGEARLGTLLSPLLDDLLQALPANGDKQRRLTRMQRLELDRLALLGHVHTPAPRTDPGELDLQPTADLGEQKVDRRERNSIVLAPEEWGKTTLAMLAAVNHSLVHTRNTLVILHRRRQANDFYRRLHDWLAPSTLRWNVRVRQMDHNLVEDLDQGIQPDVVVCDLENLVVNLLDHFKAFIPFLRHLGLVVLDDADSFSGAGELHAQLALRRLQMLLRDAQNLPELDQELALEQHPLFLVLGTDSMHQSASWIENLCGIRAEARRYGPQHETRASGETESNELETIHNGKHHRFYRLAAFLTAGEEPVTLETLIESCERCSVPWHYRWCGDHRRHLGRKPLRLTDDPDHGQRSAAHACVVLLDGSWADVQREMRRLCLAGLRFDHRQHEHDGELEPIPCKEPIAFICRISPEEDAAFTQADDRAELAELLSTLPRPVLRSPDNATAKSHLASDLTQHWSEIADLVYTFGTSIHTTLQELASQNLLLAEPRMDIHSTAHEYQPALYIRALAQGIAQDTAEQEHTPLPTKVNQVQWTTESPLRLIDRTTSLLLDVIDADSARIAYYPGRIFVAANGRFVIVPHQASETEEENGQRDSADEVELLPRLYAEPLLTDYRSSPRRWVQVHVRQDGRGHLRGASLSTRPYFGPERVILGDYPFQLSLANVQLEVRHAATYRLHPITGRLHQRQVFSSQSNFGDDAKDTSRLRGLEAVQLVTEAVGLFPNPQLGDIEPPPPELTLQQARLLAAALRQALPSLYRGAEDLIDVALQIESGQRADDHVLLPEKEGFFFFDLYAGGNGTARALHREGVELLLRMARAILERNLYPRRLLNRHDHWFDEIESRDNQDSRMDSYELAQQQQALDQQLRHGTLAWLDSRLAPEGGPISQNLGAGSDVTSEPASYYSIDTGRCWAPPGRLDRDLVWVKHRWRLEPLGEAMMDIGFERSEAEQTRLFTEQSKVLLAYRQLYEAALEHPGLRLDDGTVWGEPRPVVFPQDNGNRFDRSVLAPEASPEASQTGGSWLPHYHSLASAVAAHTLPLLRPLSQHLLELAEDNLKRYGDAESSNRQDYRRLTYFARFVQGLPYSLPTSLQQGLRPPVTTLLYRRGDCDSKSLLLALLLKHAGIPAGLFVSLRQRHAVTAIGVERSPDKDIQDVDATAALYLAEWAERVGLKPPPCLWSTLPALPTNGDSGHLFVPVEATSYQPIGAVQLSSPETWSFLPLETIDQRFDLRDRPAPQDNLEHSMP